MAFDAHKNLAVSAVATAPSPATSGTSLVVTATEGARFPAAPFNATVWPASGSPTPVNAEVVRVTALAGDTLTITRAQEGTTARSIVSGDVIAATITAKTLTDIETGFGYWTTVPFNAANFSWPVVAGEVKTNAYTRIGNTLIWTLAIEGTTISAAVADLSLTLPGGATSSFPVASFMMKPGFVNAAGAVALDYNVHLGSATTIKLARGGPTIPAGFLYLYVTITLGL